VLRTYGGELFALDAHLERLERSCERVMITPPARRETLRAEVEQTVARVGAPDAYVRIVITRGSGPLTFDVTTARDPVRVIIAQPVSPPPAEVYERGVGLLTVPWGVDQSPAAGAKDSNYLPNLLATHRARQAGAYEALVLGAGGEVLEGASSNLFLVRGGRVLTPPLSLGILAGITRGLVLEAAGAEGIEAREALLYPHDLYRAEELFITSSIREVVPVVEVDGVRIGAGRPGAVTRRLHRAYRARLPGGAGTN